MVKNKLIMQIRNHFPRATRNQKERIHKLLAHLMRGSGDLVWGGGGRKMPPHHSKHFVALFDRKMVHSLITRRD